MKNKNIIKKASIILTIVVCFLLVVVIISNKDNKTYSKPISEVKDVVLSNLDKVTFRQEVNITSIATVENGIIHYRVDYKPKKNVKLNIVSYDAIVKIDADYTSKDGKKYRDRIELPVKEIQQAEDGTYYVEGEVSRDGEPYIQVPKDGITIANTIYYNDIQINIE